VDLIISNALLVFAIVAATIVGRSGAAHFKLPWITAVIAMLLAACFLVQLGQPYLLALMERDRSAIEGGQPYRLFTALWFQDGGVAGATFNIAILAIVGALAEQMLSKIAWLGIYLIGALMSEAVALAWQPIGAGNSIANMSLVGALLGCSLSRQPFRHARIVAGLGLGAGLLLCLMADIHGAAILIGFALLLLARAGSDTGPAVRMPC
jgi:rhomboid protease GluP